LLCLFLSLRKNNNQMTQLFISIRILDVIDILLVAFLFYQIYMLIRGTVAINIFVAIFSIYLFWLLVKALNMQLVSSILGQVIGVGAIALIIVFQQEIRRFLLLIGTRYLTRKWTLNNILSIGTKVKSAVNVKALQKACTNMSKTKTGALIVIARKSGLQIYAETGDIINAKTSNRLLESIFFKNSPLHDGAVIIQNEKILAARCILPVSESMSLAPHLGMRHRAALGMAEENDSIVIIVSEETGKISVAENGQLQNDIGLDGLKKTLENEFIDTTL